MTITALDWIDRAIRAGNNPVVILHPDGSRGICTTQDHIDREISPGALPDDIFSEVLDWLV